MRSEYEVIFDADQWLKTACQELDGDAVLTSPFLSFDICQRIATVFTSSPYKCQVITSLDPNAVANGYLSVKGIEVLLDSGVQVKHLNRLHAKCFVLGSRAMLGSANLTGAGLGSSAKKNTEMGVELNASQRQRALDEIATWPCETVRPSALSLLIERSKSLSDSVENANEPANADTAVHIVEKLLLDARDTKRRFWVKLGYGTPNLEAWRHEHFIASPNKGKPSFKPGDLVFISAKDTGHCYAVVEVISEAERAPDYYTQAKGVTSEAIERWPWANRTIPRLVPDHLLELKQSELGIKPQALQNGHVSLSFDQFTAGVRSLARLLTP